MTADVDFIAYMCQAERREPGKVTLRYADFEGCGSNTVTVPDDEWGWATMWRTTFRHVHHLLKPGVLLGFTDGDDR